MCFRDYLPEENYVFEDVQADMKSQSDRDEEIEEAYQRQKIKSRKGKEELNVLLMEDYFSDPSWKPVAD